MNNFYITTTLPYVNSSPHIGFAMELVTADVLARFHRLLGDEVVFNTGTDEHGLKIFQLAEAQGVSPQAYTDRFAQQFKDLQKLLTVSATNFIRTTDSHHLMAAQEFWKRCDRAGDIYKKLYRIKYCVGCEMEKTESELVDNRCPLHPNRELEIIEEENYFFRFSKYQQPLLNWYRSHQSFVMPVSKQTEIEAFVSQGLQDFSISRLKDKLPWGVPVPGDEAHVMYVWFDALINYISTLGWPEDEANFSKFWPGVQIAGKDNLRQQAAMWQAMLMSAGIQLSQQILINGFISVDGQKMSKSLGNVIGPDELVARYGVDGGRYLLLSIGPVAGDIDVTWDKFDTSYNATLANSLGNTVQRVATLCERSGFDFAPDTPPGMRSQVKDRLNDYQMAEALGLVLETVRTLEKNIGEAQPWKMTGQPLKVFLTEAVAHLRQVGFELQPFLPETAAKISLIFSGPQIQIPDPLFPRL